MQEKTSAYCHRNRLRASGSVTSLLALIVWANAMWAGTPPMASSPVENLPPVWERYLQVVDLLFPRRVVDETPSEFVLILRFLPAFDRDSQIVILKKPLGGFAVTYFALPRGSKSIGWQLTEAMAGSKTDDPTQIAKQISVEVRKIDVPTSIISRQFERIQSLPVSPLEELNTGFVPMDATTYQFWLQRPGDPAEFYMCLHGAVYGKGSNPHRIVIWMNEFKEIVEKYSKKGMDADR